MKNLIFNLDTINNNVGLRELKKLFPDVINLKIDNEYPIEEEYNKIVKILTMRIESDEKNVENIVLFCSGMFSILAFKLRKHFMLEKNIYVKIICVNPIFNIDKQLPDNLFNTEYKKFLELDINIIRDSIIIITDDLKDVKNRFVKQNITILRNNGIIYSEGDSIYFSDYFKYIYDINNYINSII